MKYCAYPLSTMGAIGANASAGTARPDLSNAVEFGERVSSVVVVVVVVVVVDGHFGRRPRKVSTLDGRPFAFLVFFPWTVIEEEEPPLPPPGGGLRPPRCLSTASSPADINNNYNLHHRSRFGVVYGLLMPLFNNVQGLPTLSESTFLAAFLLPSSTIVSLQPCCQSDLTFVVLKRESVL